MLDQWVKKNCEEEYNSLPFIELNTFRFLPIDVRGKYTYISILNFLQKFTSLTVRCNRYGRSNGSCELTALRMLISLSFDLFLF